MDFTISDELQSVQQLAAQILGDFTEPDKLKVIEQQDAGADELLEARTRRQQRRRQCETMGRSIS